MGLRQKLFTSSFAVPSRLTLLVLLPFPTELSSRPKRSEVEGPAVSFNRLGNVRRGTQAQPLRSHAKANSFCAVKPRIFFRSGSGTYSNITSNNRTAC
jgi:hypothetical protein